MDVTVTGLTLSIEEDASIFATIQVGHFCLS